jgi:trehalose-6-phosphate synthase
MISKNYCLGSGIYSIQTVNDQIFLRGQATVRTANIQGTTRIQTSCMFISAILISINPEEFKKAGFNHEVLRKILDIFKESKSFVIFCFLTVSIMVINNVLQ